MNDHDSDDLGLSMVPPPTPESIDLSTKPIRIAATPKEPPPIRAVDLRIPVDPIPPRPSFVRRVLRRPKRMETMEHPASGSPSGRISHAAEWSATPMTRWRVRGGR